MRRASRSADDESPLERAIRNRGLASERTEASERRKQRQHEAKPLEPDVSPNESASDITQADEHPTEPPNCEGIEREPAAAAAAAETEVEAETAAEAHD